MATMQALHDEHTHLFPHIEALRTTADAIGSQPLGEVLELVDESLDFLLHHLVPHAAAEDEALYPVVDRLIGEGATATMRRDHTEVHRLVHELYDVWRDLSSGVLSDGDANDLRRLLYGLYAVVGLHFAKEEEVYVPILEERLSDEEGQAVLNAMHESASKNLAA
jgi:hemerythrin-like domain-containing protein